MMIIIGEKLNSSIPSVNKAFSENDSNYVKTIAKRQIECGANYLDVNTGVFLEEEIPKLLWVVENILSEVNAPLVIDTPNPKAIKAVLDQFRINDAIINSITLEPERIDNILPFVCEYNTKIIALPVDVDGIPEEAEKRFENAAKLIEILRKNKISDERIYIDALVMALSYNHNAGLETLKTIKMLRKHYPEVHITGGLSNVSFGLPKRTNLNSAFLTSAITMGLDSAIMDITNKDIRFNLACALLVSGQDEYCMNYLEAYREE